MTNVKSPAELLDVVHLLQATPLFSDLPKPHFAALLAPLARHHVEAGQLLFHEGDPAEHFLLVKQGCVEMLRFTVDGEERVFHLFKSGQLVAEAAMFMPHGRYPMNARAQCATTVYCLSRSALRKTCENHPPLAMRMLEILSQRLYRQVNEVDWLTASSASQRLAAYLLGLQQHQGNCVCLPISQRQLATHLGIRSESLSRLFSEWQKRGQIRGRQRNWELCDLIYLRQLASAAARTF